MKRRFDIMNNEFNITFVFFTENDKRLIGLLHMDGEHFYTNSPEPDTPEYFTPPFLRHLSFLPKSDTNFYECNIKVTDSVIGCIAFEALDYEGKDYIEILCLSFMDKFNNFNIHSLNSIEERTVEEIEEFISKSEYFTNVTDRYN